MSILTLRLGGMLLLALTLPARAQFAQLAVTDDGKQLYFTSSLLLRTAPSTDQALFETRIYRYTSGAVTLFAERGPLAPPGIQGSDQGAASPQVTADGSTVGFTYYTICASPTDSDCANPIDSQSELRGARTLDLGPGTLQLSRNGRWALLTPMDVATPQNSTLIDLTTGQRTTVPPPASLWYSQAYRTLASDGTVLVQLPDPRGNGARGLWKQGQLNRISFPAAAISDDASTLVSQDLVAFDVASQKQTALFHPATAHQAPELMGMSTNGRLVLYRISTGNSYTGPAFLANTVTGQVTPIILPEGELVADGTLTGQGDAAFLATTAGRIVKATFFLPGIQQLFPSTPQCDLPEVVPGVAPGERLSLHCNFAGTPASLQGALLMNGVPVPVLSTAGNTTEVQVPWGGHDELFGDEFDLNVPSNSPFQAAQLVQPWPMAPGFVPADPGQSTILGLKLVKGDWSAPLTTQPSPGDIIYAYMTGLGSVDGPMEDGQPASLTVPEPILGWITCQFSPQKTSAETLFAGLAPGTIGYYQVAFRMPPDAGAAPIDGVSCNYPTPYSSIPVPSPLAKPVHTPGDSLIGGTHGKALNRFTKRASR